MFNYALLLTLGDRRFRSTADYFWRSHWCVPLLSEAQAKDTVIKELVLRGLDKKYLSGPARVSNTLCCDERLGSAKIRHPTSCVDFGFCYTCINAQ